METVITFFTSNTGIIASIVVIIGLIGGVMKIVLPLINRHESRQASISRLDMSAVKIEDPPPHSEAGQASFELMNTGGGKAIMSDFLLVILNNGPSETPKMVEAAAPVSQFTYKVTLEPEVKEYDIRKKAFGSSAPHSYESEEVESFLVELRSTKPQWYELQFVVRWYDAKNPSEINEFKSNTTRIEFKPLNNWGQITGVRYKLNSS